MSDLERINNQEIHSVIITDMDSLCRNSIELIHYARNLAVRQINIIEIMTNYALGRWIVEEQQNGQDRAQYGAHVIDRLAEALTAEFGRGYSTDTLKNARKFYLTYKERISEPMFHLFASEKSEPVVNLFKKNLPFTLPWTHYLILMRIQNPEERNFYEIEATNGNWSKRVLQRQYSSSLYERLLLSSDKDKVTQLSTQGYDRYEKTEEENPTVGILLCRDKNDALVELTLPLDANVYAAKYELYLPDKKLLQQKLTQWLAEEEEQQQ